MLQLRKLKCKLIDRSGGTSRVGRTFAHGIAKVPEQRVVHQSPGSAYVHLPFCKRKCFYCDFPVVALGSDSQNSSQYGSYVDLLLREISSYAGVEGSKPLRTIFFGGGTPSLTPPQELERILTSLDKTFGIDSGAEISMEADPGTFDRSKLKDFVSLGVNRFSMGVQSFDSKLLELCGRSHSVDDVYQAIEDIHFVQPKSWSLDLMFGLPHQSLHVWQHSIAEALKASPDHISCYDLQVEEGTPFAKWYEVGMKPLPSEDAGASFFRMASERFGEAKYLHYEISNYAKIGHESKHNLNYWNNGAFYGFGMGATSYVGNARLKRPVTLSKYKSWLDKGYDHSESDFESEPLLELIMLRLRLKEGLLVDGLDEKFNRPVEKHVWKALQHYISEDLVIVTETNRGRFASLSDPEGFLLSNSIISDVFAALD